MAYTTINKHTDHFNTKLYAGNNTGQSITGVGFEPSLTWIKSRTASERHCLTDAVRGVYKELRSNETAAESDRTSYGGLSAFGADGFTVGGDDGYNNGSNNYASWNWKANGAGSANTNGATNSTVSVNTAAGFSIVSWTGTGSATTVGHGLGAAPELIILKNRTGVYGWQTYWKVLGSNKYLALSSTDAVVTSTQSWNNTAPTSTVFSVDGDSNNKSGQNIVAYCFKEKTGYSKFGSFQGNSSADGSMIYLGFKPSFVIYKRYDSGAYSWVLVDNKRGAGDDELIKKYFHPNSSAAEASTTLMDFLSNGFKMRVNDTTSNQGSIVYMAFGQSIVGSNNVPATAR